MGKKTDKKPIKSKAGVKAASKPAKAGASKAAAKASPRAAAAKAAPKPAPKTAAKIPAPGKTAPPIVERKKPLPRSAALFKVGERVVYPFHGVGVVRGIDRIRLSNDDQWYYTLDFRNGELIVKLPVDQQEEKGMRRVVGKADVEKIMTILRKKPPSEESDWKVRYHLYLEKLKSGDIYEAAKVARNLSKRGPEGELSMSEKRLLEASVQLLVHEIAEASREPIEKVEVEINKCLRSGRA